uniref:LRAT domain-containing protein n=1 Tax=Catharus ustulatus TaxID=91951 RepID=A0A8C3VA42_CATUS
HQSNPCFLLQSLFKPQPGDLIEIDQPFHQHWALYLGVGVVINLTPVGKCISDRRVAEVFSQCFVKRQLLKEVVGNHKWHVNNKSDEYQTPLPVKQIIQRAAAYVELRYGEAVSEQSSSWATNLGLTPSAHGTHGSC